jgi:dihydrofolate synthase / folylpolyglutamate synthase
MPNPDTLEAWLAHVERLHHRPIDLGLDRVRAVAERLGIVLDATKIIVGGTNGKGSTCAMLDAILRAAGYRVGRYGSPHLLRFEERAQIDGVPATPQSLLEHFQAVEDARGDTTLTYFEFTTLAVLRLFARLEVDVAVLEVGLGGRLDAVNIIDADCSIVTTVDLDHTELLGETRDAIGLEKAHIYRKGRPAVCADPDPPASLIEYAQRIGAKLLRLGVDFHVEGGPASGPLRQWNFIGQHGSRLALPVPALRGPHQLRNAAGVLAVLEALDRRVPVDQHAVRKGLATVQLAGRFQVVPGRPAIVLDVAHNPHAARALSQALIDHAGIASDDARAPRTVAVLGMLRDKDVHAVVQAVEAPIAHWHLAPTEGDRGIGARELAARAFAGDTARRAHTEHDSVAAALSCALGSAGPDDRIVVFGSFIVVAEAMRWLERSPR